MGRPLGTHRDLKPRMRPARGPGTWELEPQPLLEASLQDQTCGSDKGQGGKAARKQRGRLRREPTHACRLVHVHSGPHSHLTCTRVFPPLRCHTQQAASSATDSVSLQVGSREKERPDSPRGGRPGPWAEPMAASKAHPTWQPSAPWSLALPGTEGSHADTRLGSLDPWGSGRGCGILSSSKPLGRCCKNHRCVHACGTSVHGSGAAPTQGQ